MKGAIEFYVMFLLFMIVVLLGIQIVGAFTVLQNTQWEMEMAVRTIEEFDDVNEIVEKEIEQRKICNGCKVEIDYYDEMWHVNVSNVIKIPILNWETQINFHSVPNIHLYIS